MLLHLDSFGRARFAVYLCQVVGDTVIPYGR